jgi:hypothetical protein
MTFYFTCSFLIEVPSLLQTHFFLVRPCLLVFTIEMHNAIGITDESTES